MNDMFLGYGTLVDPNRQSRRLLAAWVLVTTAIASPYVSGQTADRTGEQVVKARCANCHVAGVGGAPKIGDRSAWIPRLKQGLDQAIGHAIRGHGAMPARGGLAELTDGEIRNAVIYMLNPEFSAVASSAKASADAIAAARASPGSRHARVGGMDVYLGVVSAESLRVYPKSSVEGSMHGGVPSERGYFHVGVSVINGKSNTPVSDAWIEAVVEQPGLIAETKRMDPLVINNSMSYGNYFKMAGRNPYSIKVRIQRPGLSQPVEAKFQYQPE